MAKNNLETVQGLLDEAVRCEEISRMCGPGDPSSQIFRRDAAFYFNEALKLETKDGQ